MRLLLFLLAAAITGSASPSGVVSSLVVNDNNNDDTNLSDNGDDNLFYQCPSSVEKAQNDFDDYWTTYKEMNQENLDDLINFRNRGYDYRQATYSQMQENTYDWKEAFFGSVLASGDHIYESACGEGLNLFMTVETLKECCGIVNITIHGNDYLQDSVHVAKRIYQQEAAEWFNPGVMCQGDSTNLSHVPSDAFDLAYTGFIDPLLDPLELMDPTASLDDKVEMIEEICESEDEETIEIAERMQKVQEDWHAAWVSELVRITKPGKYVVIEDVGWPACSMITEWGGVDTDWWAEAVEQYGWDVDVESIEILDDRPYTWYENRYNVRMRKNDKLAVDRGETVEATSERKETGSAALTSDEL